MNPTANQNAWPANPAKTATQAPTMQNKAMMRSASATAGSCFSISAGARTGCLWTFTNCGNLHLKRERDQRPLGDSQHCALTHIQQAQTDRAALKPLDSL